MKRNEAITKIMTTELKTVHLGQKLSEVRNMLAESPFHHVPVVSGENLVGLISATDMVKLSLSAYGVDQQALDGMLDSQHTIESVMSKDLITIKESETVRDAATMLSKGTFHALPVVDGEKLVGMVTSTDIIHYLLDQY